MVSLDWGPQLVLQDFDLVEDGLSRCVLVGEGGAACGSGGVVDE